MQEIDLSALDKLGPVEREEARKLLEALQQKYDANPLLKYKGLEKQDLFHASHVYTKVLYGGNRSGKTTAGIVDDIIQAIDREAVPSHLLEFKHYEPPFHCRIVCPSNDIMESTIFQKIREWVPRDQLVGNNWGNAFSKSQRILRFKNGSFFDFMTYEQDLDKFTGTAKHRIHYDEEPPELIRLEGLSRLNDYAGAGEVFTMTPEHGLSWMYTEIWEPWEKGQLEDAFVVVVDMDDNYYLDPEQKRKSLARMSPEQRQAKKEGRFVHFAGMIYPEFSRTKHIIPEASIPKGAYVYVGIDPGYRVMAGVVWAYVTPEGRIVVFDELGLQRSTVFDVAEAIKLVNFKHGEEGKSIEPRHYIIDPIARNIIHQTGRSDQMEFADHGIYTVLGQNAVPAGINRVRERLANGKLLIMGNCPKLIDEFRKYRWATPGRTENDPKEKPVKKDDHLLDALRYIVQARPYGPPDIQKARSMTHVEYLMEREREALNRPQTRRVEGIPI